MTDWEEDDWIEEEMEEEASCDYGVSEICFDPQTKEMGLCTTECGAYLKLVEEEARRKIE